MNLDIGDIMDEWPYRPGQITARRINGSDGVEKIQLRLDLGILQMNSQGRPDGQRPHDCESLLDYYRQELASQVADSGSDEGFTLDERACELLRSEAVLYYHRYLAEFVLEDYSSVARDTERNLVLMDFCAKYAHDASDRYVLEQYRPYVLMMNTRAEAQLLVRDQRPKAALSLIEEGIAKIKEFFERFDHPDMADESTELVMLRALAGEIESGIPKDPVQELRDALDQAISDERYEEAADLRDRIARATDDRSNAKT
ncbi:MAG: UvrB/UvrC motif-containing protein [Phycisphaerae bacterium]|nr:UvrB/UvrC motif-containing protein [Phycisphaerae bacterium]